MLKTFSLACLGLLLSSVLACAADDAPTGADSHGLEQSHRTAEGQSFEMQLHRDVTAETIIPAIIAAGHAELAALCSSSSYGRCECSTLSRRVATRMCRAR